MREVLVSGLGVVSPLGVGIDEFGEGLRQGWSGIVDAGEGDNIVFGDNGRITAAESDAHRFAGHPLTLGLVEARPVVGDAELDHVAEPAIEDGPFRMLATTLEADPFLGRLLTGRVASGSIKANQPVKALSRDGSTVETFRASKVLAFRGLRRQPIDRAEAGDIVALAGMQKPTVADTLCAPSVNQPIPAQPVDPPTISVTFGINDSPQIGRAHV